MTRFDNRKRPVKHTEQVELTLEVWLDGWFPDCPEKAREQLKELMEEK